MNEFSRQNSFSPDFPGTPEGMWGPELALWKQFQSLHWSEWQRIWFNVRVGPGEPLPAGSSENEQAYWREVTQRRIDVLIEIDGNIIIVELRCNADKGTFGAAMLYRELWSTELRDMRKLRTMIVTNRMKTDMQSLCQKNGIEVVIIKNED